MSNVNSHLYLKDHISDRLLDALRINHSNKRYQ